MIASLPMYDLPELRSATDAWWTGLSGHLRAQGLTDVPVALTRTDNVNDVQRAPDLLLSQTCGYPLTHELSGKVGYVATPAYDADGCQGPAYRSAVIVRADDPAAGLADLKGKVCTVNGPGSHSGYNALRHALASVAAGQPVFSDVHVSGGHRQSIAAVASGRADAAAIDCVTLALVSSQAPKETSAIRVLAFTERAPGLPYITSRDATAETVDAIRNGLRAAVEDPSLAACRAELLISGVDILSDDAYRRIDDMEDQAVSRGYPVIR